MEKIIKILMERDRVSRSEAEDLIMECREELESGNYEAIHDILGLEDDYLFDVLGM